ncbi:cobalamin B12-binding domain-containing protein [Anaerospora hongkongensis]|uniref:cobalamin B12-binding domain-containing protein n=1 Tax=Anaerospora hongkongensis TaxID=244830 RepID=UPI00289915EC|nr:cobalamin-dependent protein [Anaerospora hongkongensis]
MQNFDLVQALTELDENAVLLEVQAQLDEGVPTMEILIQLQQGMEQVGKRYESGDYFLAELIMSADIFSSAAALMETFFTSGCESKAIGTMVIGTVKDDIHDIGKNIVSAILSCSGIKVVDLGVDVATATFVKAVKMNKPQTVGLCCLLTTAFDAMKETVSAVKAVDPSIKVLIGGGPVDEKVAQYCGADKYCRNAYAAVSAARKSISPAVGSKPAKQVISTNLGSGLSC